MKNMQASLFKLPRRSLMALAVAALVTACGGEGGSNDDHAHSDTVVDTAGRLALAENSAAGVRVYDLDCTTTNRHRPPWHGH
jgi:cytochrome c5